MCGQAGGGGGDRARNTSWKTYLTVRTINETVARERFLDVVDDVVLVSIIII